PPKLTFDRGSGIKAAVVDSEFPIIIHYPEALIHTLQRAEFFDMIISILIAHPIIGILEVIHIFEIVFSARPRYQFVLTSIRQFFIQSAESDSAHAPGDV